MSLLIPAAWVPLGAGGPDGSEPSRPALRTLETDGARVSIRVDRTAVEAGERVTVELVGVADAERDVAVQVALQERNGSPMSRVPTPPTTVESEKITLAAAPGGGAPRQVSFLLAGPQVADGSDPVLMAGAVSQYTILVTPASDAPAEPGLEVWNGDVAGSGAAMVQVSAQRPTAFAVTLDAKPTDDGEQTFAGTLRIRNTSTKTLKGFTSGLSAYPSMQLLTEGFAPTSAEWEIEWTDGSGGQVAELAPGQEAVLHFDATLSGSESGTLHANVWASYGGLGSDSRSFSADAGSIADDEANGDEPVVGMRFAQPPPASVLSQPAPSVGGSY